MIIPWCNQAYCHVIIASWLDLQWRDIFKVFFSLGDLFTLVSLIITVKHIPPLSPVYGPSVFSSVLLNCFVGSSSGPLWARQMIGGKWHNSAGPRCCCFFFPWFLRIERVQTGREKTIPVIKGDTQSFETLRVLCNFKPLFDSIDLVVVTLSSSID